MLRSLVYMFFPRLCGACQQPLNAAEQHLCFHCKYRLPRTNFHLYRDNPVEQLFWGRVPLRAASAFYYFRREGKVQHLLHQLKYKGAKDMGREIGRLYGRELLRADAFAGSSCVIPVPLSPEKQRVRGYNQSAVFGEGLADSLGSCLMADALEKVRVTETQTKKARYARWENVAEVYRVASGTDISDRSVLLVDDVVTTGATLEACAGALLAAGAAQVSIACIAAALRNH